MTLMAAGSVIVTLTLAALARQQERRPAVPGARPGVPSEAAATE
jgi:hypothetical protein